LRSGSGQLLGQATPDERLDEDIHHGLGGPGLEDDPVLTVVTDEDPVPEAQHALVGVHTTEGTEFGDHAVNDLLVATRPHHLVVHDGERVHVLTLGRLPELGVDLEVGGVPTVEVLCPVHGLGAHRQLLDGLHQVGVVAHVERVAQHHVTQVLDLVPEEAVELGEPTGDHPALHLVRELARDGVGNGQQAVDLATLSHDTIDHLLVQVVHLSGDGLEAHHIVALLRGIHHVLQHSQHLVRERSPEGHGPVHQAVADAPDARVETLSGDHSPRLVLGHVLTRVVDGRRDLAHRHILQERGLCLSSNSQVHRADIGEIHLVPRHVLDGALVQVLQRVLTRTVGAAHQHGDIDGLILGDGDARDHGIDHTRLVQSRNLVLVGRVHLDQDHLHGVIEVPPTVEVVGLLEARTGHDPAEPAIEEAVLTRLIREVDASHVDEGLVGDDSTQEGVGHGGPRLAVVRGLALLLNLLTLHAQDHTIGGHVDQVLRSADVQTMGLPTDVLAVHQVAETLHVRGARVIVGILGEHQPVRHDTLVEAVLQVLDHGPHISLVLALTEHVAVVDPALRVPHSHVMRSVREHGRHDPAVGADLTLQVLRVGDHIVGETIHDDGITLDQTIRGRDPDVDTHQHALDDVSTHLTTALVIDDHLRHLEGELQADEVHAIVVGVRRTIHDHDVEVHEVAVVRHLAETADLRSTLGGLGLVDDLEAQRIQTPVVVTLDLEEEGVAIVGPTEGGPVVERTQRLGIELGHLLVREDHHPELVAQVSQPLLQQPEVPVARAQREQSIHRLLGPHGLEVAGELAVERDVGDHTRHHRHVAVHLLHQEVEHVGVHGLLLLHLVAVHVILLQDVVVDGIRPALVVHDLVVHATHVHARVGGVLGLVDAGCTILLLALAEVHLLGLLLVVGHVLQELLLGPVVGEQLLIDDVPALQLDTIHLVEVSLAQARTIMLAHVAPGIETDLPTLLHAALGPADVVALVAGALQVVVKLFHVLFLLLIGNAQFHRIDELAVARGDHHVFHWILHPLVSVMAGCHKHRRATHSEERVTRAVPTKSVLTLDPNLVDGDRADEAELVAVALVHLPDEDEVVLVVGGRDLADDVGVGSDQGPQAHRHELDLSQVESGVALTSPEVVLLDPDLETRVELVVGQEITHYCILLCH
jgi:hypothetical protein